ncbi:MAG: radical SAM protein [Endomicrobiales bacterium]|nr:radical SAM protein [Endomicrobiales bacterium]
MEISIVGITRILNPTSIDLGEYVINPYKGCEFSCLYCYARYNKSVQKDKRPWGTYVDVRINSPQLLEKELFIRKPKKVLLGSITECFQPVEKEYQVTKRILEILNLGKIHYSILTRSPIIAEYLDLLKEGFCDSIYFTVNNYNEKLKKLLEPKSPSFEERKQAILALSKSGINVIPYFSPLLPFVSDIKEAFRDFKEFKEIDFEGLNFNLGNIRKITEIIGSVYPELKPKYNKLPDDPVFYNKTWKTIKDEIELHAKQYRIRYDIYLHGLKDYFSNKYSK